MEGTLSVDTINEKTNDSGVRIDGVLLKGNEVTSHTVIADNYKVGGTNFISATRQGNFRDLEVKDTNNNLTILLTGDGGNISMEGTLSVDTITEKTPSNGLLIDSDIKLVGTTLFVNGVDVINSISANTSDSSNNKADITTINNLNIANKFAGTVTSGLKTLIEDNDTDITNIKTKTDFITVTQNVDLNTMKSNIETNNAKTGITTTQANNITTNNSKVGISTAQGNAINALVGANATTVAQMSANAGSQLLTNIAANTANITANTNAYPQFTNLKRLYNLDGDIYNDGKIKFRWNAIYRQLQFYVLDIGSSEYLTGGVQKWQGTSRTSLATYLSQGESTAYKYFTTPQIPANSSIVNTTFNLTNSYTRAIYYLTPFYELFYPSYEITILIGSATGYHQISIKKFSY